VGTPAYIAPEVLLRQEYDGKVILSLLLCFQLEYYYYILPTSSYALGLCVYSKPYLTKYARIIWLNPD
jgi:serine/threonine protein kinase